ncbi:MAG: 2'-5' RNA ligase family protein [Pseudonocardiaceae bacterium]
MARLSFAVRPPAEVLALVTSLPRPQIKNVIWSRPERWIVKLRPLGHVPSQLQRPLLEAVEAELDGAPAVRACLGPATQRLAGQWLGLPVTGLDGLAAAIFDATAPLVPVTHPQPFRADLVLARGQVPPDLTGIELRAEWTVTEVLLIADRSAPNNPRLDDLGAIRLV